jgi:N-acetylglutamate synthase-like GNAT family acetyltransferase
MGFQRPVPLEAQHRTENFQSGAGSLDEWLHKHALQSHRSGGSRVFVTTETDSGVAGYYALAAGAVMSREAPVRLVRGLAGNQPVPVVLLGRLAVDVRNHGQHLGRSLLLDAMTRVIAAGELIGIRALLVHAIDRDAREWHAQFGFERSPTHPLHLLLLIKDLRTTLEQLGR